MQWEDVPPALLDLWWQTWMPLMAGRKICKERGVERFPSQRDGCAAGWKPSGILFRAWTCNQWDLTMSMETPKLKMVPDQSNHNENIIQLFFCHTLKSPMLQFVNVNGARRPSLSFSSNGVGKPSLSCPQCYCASQSFREQVIKISCGATVFSFSLLPLLAAGSFHPAAC